MYVLDEPSIGLHQRDNERLITTLHHLRDLGNTLIVVEHDEDTIKNADWVIDIGPGAGEHGGEVIYSGPAKKLVDAPRSVTGDYIAGRRKIEVPQSRRKVRKTKQLRVVGARENNLKDLTVNFPLGVFTCVTGVSGSGKSTLVNQILYPVLADKLNGARIVPGKHTRVEGVGQCDKVIHVDRIRSERLRVPIRPPIPEYGIRSARCSPKPLKRKSVDTVRGGSRSMSRVAGAKHAMATAL